MDSVLKNLLVFLMNRLDHCLVSFKGCVAYDIDWHSINDEGKERKGKERQRGNFVKDFGLCSSASNCPPCTRVSPPSNEQRTEITKAPYLGCLTDLFGSYDNAVEIIDRRRNSAVFGSPEGTRAKTCP